MIAARSRKALMFLVSPLYSWLFQVRHESLVQGCLFKASIMSQTEREDK